MKPHIIYIQGLQIQKGKITGFAPFMWNINAMYLKFKFQATYDKRSMLRWATT